MGDIDFEWQHTIARVIQFDELMMLHSSLLFDNILVCPLAITLPLYPCRTDSTISRTHTSNTTAWVELHGMWIGCGKEAKCVFGSKTTYNLLCRAHLGPKTRSKKKLCVKLVSERTSSPKSSIPMWEAFLRDSGLVMITALCSSSTSTHFAHWCM